MQHLLKQCCLFLPADGFGAQGKSPDVPPHATLEAHVALISWAKVEQVTKDGGIMKKCLKPSTEYKTPGPESKVKIRWVRQLGWAHEGRMQLVSSASPQQHNWVVSGIRESAIAALFKLRI